MTHIFLEVSYIQLVKLIVAAAAIAGAGNAVAANLVNNGNFEAQNGAGFIYAWGDGNTNITGWTTQTFTGSFPLTWWGEPADVSGFVYNYTTSPDGGSVAILDGAPAYRAALSQTISGLTVGATYNLTFYWAAGQQAGFGGPTSDKYLTVYFGEDSFTTAPQAGEEGSFQGWFTVNHSFKATSTTQVLSFLAAGLPDGQPPLTLLDGVSLTGGVPEAATWAMLIAGFGLVGAAARRRKAVVAA